MSEAILEPILRRMRIARVLPYVQRYPDCTLLDTKYAQPVLEFLAFRLGLVDPDSIRDHKRYFNREDLYAAVAQAAPMQIERHAYFQWRFNNFLFAVKG